MDALKGKLEFAKRHQRHDVINDTMVKVEDILASYVNLFPEVEAAKDKASQLEITDTISEVANMLSKLVSSK